MRQISGVSSVHRQVGDHYGRARKALLYLFARSSKEAMAKHMTRLRCGWVLAPAVKETCIKT